MIKIISKYIPFKGFTAITIWPFIIVRKDSQHLFTKVVENHEKIHGKQQKEMLIIFFLLWYLIEWTLRWATYGNSKLAYKSISFELEAYSNEKNLDYLKTRKYFAWL